VTDFRIVTEESELKEEFFEVSEEFSSTPPKKVEKQSDPTLPNWIEPVSVIVTTTAALLALRITKHWLVKKEYAVLIDLREKPAVISNVVGIPSGFVIVIDETGNTEKYEAKDVDGDVLTKILSAFK